MADESKRLDWGVRPLPKEQRQGTGAHSTPSVPSQRDPRTPPRPAGGSAVPAPKQTETKS